MLNLFKRPAFLAIVTMIVLFIVAYFAIAYSQSYSSADVDETKRRGEAVIAALEMYFQEHGSYPDSIPVESLQQPTLGRRFWEYYPDSDKKSFNLIFSSSKEWWQYNSVKKAWAYGAITS